MCPRPSASPVVDLLFKFEFQFFFLSLFFLPFAV